MSRAVHNSCHSKKGGKSSTAYVWLGVGLECNKATPIEHTNLRTFTILSQYLKIGLVIQRLVVIANTKLNYICIAKLGKTSPYICNLSILRTFLGYIFCLLLFYICTTYLYNSQLQSVVRQSPYLCSLVNRLVLTKEIIQCRIPSKYVLSKKKIFCLPFLWIPNVSNVSPVIHDASLFAQKIFFR